MAKFFSSRGPRVLRLLVIAIAICFIAIMWSFHQQSLQGPSKGTGKPKGEGPGGMIAHEPINAIDEVANEVAEEMDEKKETEERNEKKTEDEVVKDAPVDLNQAAVEEKAGVAEDEDAKDVAVETVAKEPEEEVAAEVVEAPQVEIKEAKDEDAKDVAVETVANEPEEEVAAEVVEAPQVEIKDPEAKPVKDANDVALDASPVESKHVDSDVKSEKDTTNKGKEKEIKNMFGSHVADASNTDRFNIHAQDLNNTKESEAKGRWDLGNLQTEIIDIDGHKVILHHGSHFKMLDKYPITDDPYNYVLEESTQTKLCTQAERTEFVRDKCRERNYKRWDDLSDAEFENTKLPNLLVDDTHKVMFCQSLKKSSTNKWIKFFGIASGKVTDLTKVPIHHMENIGLKGLNEYSVAERREKLKTYTKFIIVRHAYRRISNIWDDDFRVEGTATRWRLGPKLIEMFHGKGSYTHGDMLSYTDYVKYILGDKAEGYYGVTMMDACRPCLVDYNFIRRIETGPLDSEDILKKMGIYDNAVIRDAEKHHGLRSLTTSVHGLREVPQDLKDKLYERFKDDIEIFGYTQKDDRASCSIKRKDGTTCC
ncbi:hypothetical protein CAPTEDRAFT_225911 [Capitella teleta]|uniref:Carbohydrate sulfotransferase n=1 Tax=Capitella teleta TaxID=283909 RepID=R7TKY3_CAPTE|nr:hypothetical protein CAPTEDRAFT_225911 [Capitella teleta]|eukprot:ELT94493.1 hypothetical protein CAPTEDRAFT_225911 [Capitella teleta]